MYWRAMLRFHRTAWGYMQQSSTHEVTGLLRDWSAGDQGALQKLTPLVYQQLHRIAQRYMAAERSDHTLQATALIHEVYLRLVDVREINWQDRAHFFAMLGGPGLGAPALTRACPLICA